MLIRRYSTVLFATVLLSGFAISTPVEREKKKDDLRAVVQQWVDTMRAIQKEENEWARDKQVLQNYREGLQREISSLKTQVAEAEVRAKAATSDQTEKIARKEALEKASESLAGQVLKMEDQMSSLLYLIPDPLLENQKFATALEQFKKTMGTTDRAKLKGVPGRLQTVILMMTELEKFQNTITLRKSVRKASNGKDYEVEVIYLGLTRAYAVNKTADFAQVGSLGAEGWSFAEDNTLAPQVRLLVDATTGEGETQFVNIPLSVK